MTRTQIQQIIVIALLVGFGVIWATTRKSTMLRPLAPVMNTPAPRAAPPVSKRDAEPLAGEAGQEAVSLARDLFGLPSRLLQKIQEREQSLKQPPKEPSPAVEEAPAAVPPEFSSMELQGIFWGADKPQAIINRKILSVGDTIEGAKVTAITKEGVTLTHGGQQVELKPSAEIRSGQGGGKVSQEGYPP